MINQLNLLTLWAINGALDMMHLKEQLREMKAYGFDGTIFHPRYYLNQPEYLGKEYLEILSEVILYAKEIGLCFWIYDENGWPSGTANGKVMERFKESRCHWLQYEDGEVILYSKSSFNTFKKDQMEYFIRVVYDGYAQGLSEEAFAYITGFFSDEVGFLWGHGVSISMGGIPWCEEAEVRYWDLYQEDITEKWQLLFVEGDGYEQVRYRYWQILTNILAESFYAPINQWCENHGKRYTAHLKGEESIFFQVSCSGSVYGQLRHVAVPAVDALERFPGNHYYPRVVSSLAKQFQQGDCLCEAFGGSGWGLSPKHMEDMIDWLAGCGINMIAFHLWQYSKNRASIRDWPPDIPVGLTWKAALPAVFGRLRDKWNGHIVKQNRVLLVAPVRGVMSGFQPEDAMVMNEHNGDGVPDCESGTISKRFQGVVEHLYQRGMEFDVTEERLLEESGVITETGVRVGNSCYDIVIAGEGCLFERKNFIRRLYDQGVCHRSDEFLWSFQSAGENQVMLDQWVTVFPYECNDQKQLKIFFLDRPDRVMVMGQPLEFIKVSHGFLCQIPDKLTEKARQQKELIIEVVSDEGQRAAEYAPIGFLRGDFLVKNRVSYREKDDHQMMVEDCFYIADLEQDAGSRLDCTDLLTAGYPFCGSFVSVSAQTVVGTSGIVRLGPVFADCANVYVDGMSYGYVWGPDWEVGGIPCGLHQITLNLYPSTYNMYGPHHHMDGDRHLTSPHQYIGRKNFADYPDAPECTRVPQWHFVKFGIGTNKLTNLNRIS